jgi:D-3-phosphoglycerate dehydrogenase
MARFLVIDDSIHPRGIDLLRGAGSVDVVPHTTPEGELLAHLSEAEGVLLRRGRMTRRLIEGAPRLKIIARHGVGVDSVDLAALRDRRLLLTTTGDANGVAVAEYTMALLLALARHVPAATADVRDGTWRPASYLGVQLDGRTLGIVGFGQIGRLFCRRALAFGMKVLVSDPFVDQATIQREGGVKATYDQLLSESDFLSFHVRLNGETEGMFGRRQLAQVKPGVRIINTARGGICDEAALVEGLDGDVIAGVALDTFADEPLPAGHPLRRHPKAVLTPHIAGQTEDAMIAMSVNAALSIIDCIEGRMPKFVYHAEAA